MQMHIKRRNLLLAAVVIALIAAVLGLYHRYSAENNNKTVAFVTDYKDIISIARQSGESTDAVWQKIGARGVVGLTIPEYTGEDAALLTPLPLKYGTASSLGLKTDADLQNMAAVVISNSYEYLPVLKKYILLKMPLVKLIESGNDTVFILPGTLEEFKYSAFLPDVQGLEFCKKNNIVTLFRPAPCNPSGGNDVSAALDYLLSEYPDIKNIIPAGMIMSGYPNMLPIADVLKRHSVSLANVEFVKQIGVSQFASMMKPYVIPLHSLTREEIITKRISQQQIIERYVRAVHERSIRIIIVHPYDLYLGDRLNVFTEDLSAMKDSISARGYNFGWPSTLPNWPMPFAGAAACSLILVFCGWYYFMRLNGEERGNAETIEFVFLICASLMLTAVIYKVSFAAKLLGGFCGALAATEAAITALSSSKKPCRGSVVALVILISGGMSIASFYGTTDAALRLTPFSGVKLTLLLPPLLLLLHDLRQKVHDESISEILVRPAVWGELAIIGIMMVALLIMALRSDNVSSVPAFEVAFRDFMERTLVVRPRTKEFLIGYPALVLYWYLIRQGLAPHYREAVRIAAVLAFSSAINTFCHFHTLVALSFIRVVNGWWLGLLVGVILVFGLHFVLLPLLKKISGRTV